MRRPAALRALVRLAVRDARRDRWRSLLVLVLVALPVAGLVGAITLADAIAPTAEERATGLLGAADVLLEPQGEALDDGTGSEPSAAVVAAGAAELLPAGSRLEVVTTTGGELVVDGVGVPDVAVTDGPLDPAALSAGRYDLVAGRAPAAPTEVAATGAVLERAAATVGDDLEFAPLGTVTVVGEARVREHLGAWLVVTAPGALDEGRRSVFAALPPGAAVPEPSAALMVDLVGDWDHATWALTSRNELASQRFSTGERAVAIVVGGLAAVEVALVAGAAFAVSVRRRQRELGLLAAAGASRRHVRQVVLLTGVVTGVAGAVAGAVVGAAAAVAVTPWLDTWADRVTGGVALDPVWLLLSGTIGASAAVLGAWWPARGVARLPAVAALSGRRPPTTPTRTGLRAGLGLAGAGGAVCAVGAGLGRLNPYVFLLGAVLVVLGAGLCSPWLLERIGRLGPRLPTAARLAVRDAARFRARNGPIVTAAMAGLAAAVTIAAVLGSLSAQARAAYTPTLPPNVLLVEGLGAESAVTTIARDLGVQPHALAWAGGWLEHEGGFAPDGRCRTACGPHVRAAPALARDLYGEPAAAAIAAGRPVVVSTDPAVLDGAAAAPTTVVFTPFASLETGAMGQPVELPATAVPPPPDLPVDGMRLPGVLVPDELVGPVDPEELPQYLLVLDRPVDDEVLAAAGAAAAALGGTPDQVVVTAERGFRDTEAGPRRLALLLCSLFGLGIVTVALALAAAESRGDRRTLTAVGAAPRLHRALAAGRALVLAGLGGLLAVPVGLVPAYALIATVGRDLPYVVPWSAIAVVAGIVPAVATLGAVVLTRGRGNVGPNVRLA